MEGALQTSFKEIIIFGDIELNLKEEVGCKGVLSIEVKPAKIFDTLKFNGSESDLISYKNPYILKSNHPITDGVFRFKPHNSDANMKSIIRLLIVK